MYLRKVSIQKYYFSCESVTYFPRSYFSLIMPNITFKLCLSKGKNSKFAGPDQCFLISDSVQFTCSIWPSLGSSLDYKWTVSI